MPRNGQIYALNKEREDSNVCVGLAYKNPKLPSLPEGRKTKEKVMINSMMQNCKLEVREVLSVRDVSSWPSVVSAASELHGWHEKFTKIQGQGGLYFVGEPVWSAGIMAIADCVPDFCTKHFPNEE